MKFLRLIFGRLTIIALSLILQIMTIILLLYYAEESFAAVHITFVALSFLVMVNIINRNMGPDLKIPWIIIVALLPIFGVASYIMFSQNKVSLRQRKLFAKIKFDSTAAIQSMSRVDCKEAEDYIGQAKYVSHTGGFGLFANTETDYFSCGEEFFKDLISELKTARKFIFMEYFILERGKMWNDILAVLEDKVKAGVEVRVLYDDMGSISKIPANYAATLRKKGIKCLKFNKFTPIVSAVHNNRDHRKITVIDGRTAYTGGINLADEYINHISPLGYFKDSAVKLRGEGVKALTLLFLQNYNMQAKTSEDFMPFMTECKVEGGEGYVAPFGDGPRPLYKDQVAENILLDFIYGAKKSVYITTPYLILDHEIKNALCMAAKRGVDVRIITPHIPDKKLIFSLTRSNYKLLLKEGVKIYEFRPGFIHAKNVLVDDVAGMVSTVNLDYRSLVHHYECGVWMYKTTALKKLSYDLSNLFKFCDEITQDDKLLNALEMGFCQVLNFFAPLL